MSSAAISSFTYPQLRTRQIKGASEKTISNGNLMIINNWKQRSTKETVWRKGSESAIRTRLKLTKVRVSMVIGDELKSRWPKYMRPKVKINASGNSKTEQCSEMAGGENKAPEKWQTYHKRGHALAHAVKATISIHHRTHYESATASANTGHRSLFPCRNKTGTKLHIRQALRNRRRAWLAYTGM